jgi:hypothetical protein
MIRTRLGVVLAAALAGCGMGSETQLRVRAAADFQCDEQKLEVKSMPNDVYAVAGCDQKETYVYSSEARAWLRESEAGGKVITLPR